MRDRSSMSVFCENARNNPKSHHNHTHLQHYQELLNNLYVEPKDEEISGTFLLAAAEVQPQVCQCQRTKNENTKSDNRQL